MVAKLREEIRTAVLKRKAEMGLATPLILATPANNKEQWKGKKRGKGKSGKPTKGRMG
jgi:hypothetical protein